MIQLSFTKKSSLYISKINVRAKKIDNIKLKFFGIIIICFLIDNKNKKSRLFKKTFLLADISMNITLEISFLILNNIKINFTNRELIWRFYIIADNLLTTRQMELIRKKKFTITAFDFNDAIFIVYIVFLINCNLGLKVDPFFEA